MNKPFYFGSNFKMHQTPVQTAAFIDELQRLAPDGPTIQRFLIPPLTSLTTAAPLLANTSTWLGAQTMHWAEAGAYTGEISPTMLKASGVDLVMLGHAERRTLFGETDAALRKKVAAALNAGLRVLLCVGEQASEREVGVSYERVAIQLKTALHDFPAARLKQQAASLLVAYEPVWSIGEGSTPADPYEVSRMLGSIRAILTEQLGQDAWDIPLLYGGSVDLENCGSYTSIVNVQGLFVGRAAWSPQGFVEVMRAAKAASQGNQRVEIGT